MDLLLYYHRSENSTLVYVMIAAQRLAVSCTAGSRRQGASRQQELAGGNVRAAASGLWKERTG